MIKIEIVDGLACPRFICDHCHESIAEAHRAAAVWDWPAGATEAAVEHRHNTSACRPLGSPRFWESLAWHLRQLATNTALVDLPTPQAAVEAPA